MTEYRPAPSVQRIAEDLIREHHDHLADVRIEYAFRDKAAKKAGKTVFGTARKVGGLNAFLATDTDETGSDEVDDFFVIEIAEDTWRILDQFQRVALVDHELCHCVIEHDEETGEPKLKLKGHDLEEFRSIVDRHGLWEPELVSMADSMAKAVQLRFGGVDT